MTLTGLAFMLVFLGALAYALVRNPIYGLFAYIGEFYLHPPSRWWGASLPDLRWSMLAAAVTIAAILIHSKQFDKQRQAWYATTPAKLMIIFTIWFWIESLWALSPAQHFPAAVLLTKYLLVYFMVYKLIDTPERTTAFLLMHVAGCFYLGLLGYGSDPSERLDGVGGPGIDDSNTLGMHLGTGVAVAAMLTLKLRGWRRLACFAAIAFALNAIVLTGSRGAFLALVAGGFMLWYLRPRAYKRIFYVYAVLGVLAFAYVASAQFWNRMDTVKVAAGGKQDDIDVSALSRIEMAKAQLKMFQRYPLGAGHRGSEVLSARYLDARFLTGGGARSSHNVFLTILVEQGIPGVAIFAIFIAWTGLTLRRIKRENSPREPTEEQTWRAIHAGAIGGALVVVLVGGLFADFSKCEVQIWMMALLASLLQPQAVRALSPATSKAVSPRHGGAPISEPRAQSSR